jgi:hypothetical protein
MLHAYLALQRALHALYKFWEGTQTVFMEKNPSTIPGSAAVSRRKHALGLSSATLLTIHFAAAVASVTHFLT